jgi:hypothetical protein
VSRGAFLGSLGALIEFAQYKGGISVKNDRPVTFKTTLGGSKRAFVAPQRGLREWSVSTVGMSSEQFAAFELLNAGAYGLGPFRFIDPLAQSTNVLTPRGSLPGVGNEFAYTGNGIPGAGTIPGFGSVPAVSAQAGSQLWFGAGTPVIPGVPVTVSSWVRGVTELQAVFLDAAGAVVGQVTKPVAAQSAWARVHASGEPPVGAQEVRIRLTGPSAFDACLPAVSWTKQVVPWSLGRGCRSAVVHDVSDEVVDADPGSNGRMADFGFTVTEVGDGA